MPESLVRSAKVPSVLSSKPALCPGVSCVGKLELDSRMGSMTAKGLQALVCPVCKHSGYRSLQGIRVLFATRHEHVCNYGPSVQSLTVVFSGAALVSLRDRGLCPTQSATHGCTMGIVVWTVGRHATCLSGQSSIGALLYPCSP